MIREDDIYQVGGRPLLNGLFGVPKDECVGGVAVHRLIMNLILNRICRPLSGDVSTLPAWPSMHPFVVGDEEDARCFFYLFLCR